MKTIILSTLILIFTSCGSSRPKGKTAAEILYKDAKVFKESGRYLLALEKINALRSQYPYSYFATPAELLQADIFYAQENYTEAAAAYLLFRDFHPKHKRIEYVLHMIGESFFKQLPTTFDRDLGPTQDVMRYSSELIRKYPKSQYTKKAKENIAKCKDMLRQKDKYIADFYFKTGVFDSASFRYKSILKVYKKDRKLREHAIIRLVKSEEKQGRYSECINYSKRFTKELSETGKNELKKLEEYCTSEYNDVMKSQQKAKS